MWTDLGVVNGFPAAVVRLDPMSGSLTIVSGCAEGDNAGNCVGKIIGRGPLSLTQSYRAIAVEAAGQLLVAAFNTVVRVDPLSGDRTIVSGCVDPAVFPCSTTIGRGPPFLEPEAIAVEADGQLVILDRSLQAVVRVDPISGNRTIVVQGAAGRGSGKSFDFPRGIALEADGQLVVAEPFLEAVVGVDPRTGDRTIVSGCTKPGFRFPGHCMEGIIGGGRTFIDPLGIAVQATGSLVVVDSGLQAVMRVDPVSGDRIIISDATTGRGPTFVEPEAIAVEADSQLVVVDSSSRAVVRVDPVSGTRTIVSDATTGRGQSVRIRNLIT